jgi:hypothetical protein
VLCGTSGQFHEWVVVDVTYRYAVPVDLGFFHSLLLSLRQRLVLSSCKIMDVGAAALEAGTWWVDGRAQGLGAGGSYGHGDGMVPDE